MVYGIAFWPEADDAEISKLGFQGEHASLNGHPARPAPDHDRPPLGRPLCAQTPRP